MRVKLEMEFEIPEKVYKDDEEDAEIPAADLINHQLGFATQFLFDEFVNYANVNHLKDSIFNFEDSFEKSEEHKNISKMIQEAIKTARYTCLN